MDYFDGSSGAGFFSCGTCDACRRRETRESIDHDGDHDDHHDDPSTDTLSTSTIMDEMESDSDEAGSDDDDGWSSSDSDLSSDSDDGDDSDDNDDGDDRAIESDSDVPWYRVPPP